MMLNLVAPSVRDGTLRRRIQESGGGEVVAVVSAEISEVSREVQRWR
jgi:hypothetical protein